MSQPSIDRYERVSTLFRALAAPLRVAIVELLITHHQLHVHEIVKAIGAPQALTSQHLRVLRHAQLVVRVQDGRQVVYRLRDPDLSTVIGVTARFVDEQPGR